MFTSKRIQKLFIMAIILFLAILLFLFLSYRIQTTNYDIETGKIHSPLRIALITDLHSCKYGENEKPILELIDAEQPDIILLGGDIYDDDLPIETAADFIQAVSQKYPSFYVSGNHEYWSSQMDFIKEVTTKAGATVLEGNCLQLKKSNDTINICGIDDPTHIGLDSLKVQLESTMKFLDKGKYNILLAHRPELVDIYAEYGFDLVTAGHAHGGQWRLPFFLDDGLYAPDQGFFPKYTGGIHQKKETVMIVSRGLAKESTRLPRLFNRPEIIFINLL